MRASRQSSAPPRIGEQLIGALVPALPHRDAEPAVVSELPAPRSTESQRPDTVFGMARIDRFGRVRERSVFDALGWRPGRALHLTTRNDVIVLVTDPAGRHRIDSRGAVTLPAAARAMCGITYGPAVLLAGVAHHQILLVHSPAILTRALATLHRAILDTTP